ncbi:hypothetical protein IMZ31_24160 (plasmid) [Pontibacillus sp. ALD_SL1]|uniref:hypothetical protein n=1 Tax=Pontibacillus sp. ALD_SL1 TaxID=2777185 RepID=UPI001A965190|nr:hypothetical protein [Pontibacillus sp. ALD_SL1]QST02547.1 hypothetical protein IMZ31_24160 [Pontibacillus sp. ALD_SL1]
MAEKGKKFMHVIRREYLYFVEEAGERWICETEKGEQVEVMPDLLIPLQNRE